MKTLRSQSILISTLIALSLTPLHAYRGNQFLSRAIELSAAEVRLGTMAINKTRNTDVQAFAEMLVADSNQALDKLTELRAARTTVRAVPETTTVAADSVWTARRMHRSANDIPITPDHHRIAERLSLLSGGQFDRRFINEMIREHREAINFFEAQFHGPGNGSLPYGGRAYSLEDLAKDLDTADFARDTLPTLRLHLERAHALQLKLLDR